MKKNLIGRVGERQDWANTKNLRRLYFHGIVKDNQGLYTGDAIVLLSACFGDDVEKPLAYAITDQEGKYHISIPKLSGYHNLLGYKLMASKPSMSVQLTNFSDKKEMSKNQEPDIDQHLREYPIEQDNTIYEAYLTVPGLAKITEEINFSQQAEDRIVEGEYQCQPSEKAIEAEPIESSKELLKKVKNLHKRNDLSFTALFFLLSLSLLGFIITQKDASPGYTNTAVLTGN